MLGKKILCCFFALGVSISAFATEHDSSDYENRLSEFAQDINQSLGDRVVAVVELGGYGGVNSLVAIGRATRAPEKELRIAAIQAVVGWKGDGKWDVVSPLLNDTDRDVRGYAGYSLMPLWSELNEGQRKHVDKAATIYLEDVFKNTDKYQYFVQKGVVSFYKGDIALAERAFVDAIKLDGERERAYIMLSEVYSSLSDKEKVISILKKGIVTLPNSASLHFTAGLAYVRVGDEVLSEKYLKKAAMLEPDSERYLSTYAARISKTKPIEASEYLFKTAEITGREEYKSAACGVLLNISKEKANKCISENL
ncbi:hypothetical protein [Vibrio crassostreae]|uniref:hypothetical protein n=1 Tax=Vibrio crassostreae TaxID=246167 RepID=UPI001B30A5B6|nr:hypothetical protein [Vibrio crassostreae]